MSEFKGTPGPWKWESKYFGLRQTTEAGGKWILQPEPWEGMHVAYPSATRAANARLIASAPALLEAAQIALSIAESWIHDQLDGTSQIEVALRELSPVRDAIARALGEDQ